MSKTANVQGRSRGKLYETTIRRKVPPYELELVMKKLRLHLESGVGSVLFMHFGRTRQLIGDLTDIDLEDLKRRIRKKLERHRGRHRARGRPRGGRAAPPADTLCAIYSHVIVKNR